MNHVLFAPDIAVVGGFVALAVVLGTLARREAGLLAGAVAAGAALRVVFSPRTLMGMSNYEREPALFSWMEQAQLSLYAFLPDGLDRFEAISLVNLAAACVLPLLMFAWADLAFGNRRVSLWTAWLAALCPLHVYFGASDTMYITSNAVTAVFFIVLLGALRVRRFGWEILFGVAALALVPLLLFARQINFLYVAPAMVLALEVLVRRGGWGAWRKALWVGAFAVVGFQFFLEMATSLASATGARAGVVSAVLETTRGASRLHSALVTNNHLLPTIYPLPFTLLAIGGLVALWRKDRLHLLFVVVLFGVFHGGHAILPAWNATAAARYGLQSIVAVTFAAAFGADAAQRWWAVRAAAVVARPALAAAVVVLLLAGAYPVARMHSLPDSDLQEEYRFLRGLAARGIPGPGAVVVESYGPKTAAVPPSPRFRYFGRNVEGRRLVDSVTSTGDVPPDGRTVYFYQGLPCLWSRGSAEPVSGACSQPLHSGRWELVASHRIEGPTHDNANGNPAQGGTIALYRRHASDDAPPPAAAATGDGS